MPYELYVLKLCNKYRLIVYKRLHALWTVSTTDYMGSLPVKTFTSPCWTFAWFRPAKEQGEWELQNSASHQTPHPTYSPLTPSYAAFNGSCVLYACRMQMQKRKICVQLAGREPNWTEIVCHRLEYGMRKNKNTGYKSYWLCGALVCMRSMYTSN